LSTLSTFDAWKTAARPHTLPAGIAPVLVGAGIADGQGVFRWGPFLAAMVASVSIQVAANFANDASDAARGADPAHRIGPPRMVALGVISPRRMWVATWLAVAVAGAAGLYLASLAGPVVWVIGAASVLPMPAYVGGPVPYGYRGLGEAAVFVFFGLVATVGTRFVFDRSAPSEAWLAGVIMGMLAAAILVANNLRDLDTDAEAGKRTLAVMLGREATRALYAALTAGAPILTAALAVVGRFPPLTALSLLFLPFAWSLARTARTTRSGPGLIGLLKGTARLQLWVGVVIAAGMALGR